MLNPELSDKFKETLVICDIHYQRMMFAYLSINKYFPLTETKFGKLSSIEMALFDQLIYRFSKLQDIMGARLFKQLSEALEEDISGLPFIDILNKMEQIKLLESAKDWIKLRQTRNSISHEYPFYREIQIEELNLFPSEVLNLEKIWLKLQSYSQKILNS